MRSPNSAVLDSALLDQDKAPVGKALEFGSRHDNDRDDDCSCRTDMTTVRASNGQRYTTVCK
jgi:hypothetical protein